MGVIQACRNVVMNAKAQLELELAREVKGSRKGFCKDTDSKRKAKKSMHTLVNGEGDLVKSNREKAEDRNAFFFLPQVCTGRVCPQVSQVPETLIRIHGH